jgi:alpha-galactosidase
MKFILWFAPLHVNRGTVWAKEQPQFVHGGGQGGIWKLGDPQAREFLVNWLSEKSRQWGFDVYREDFGIGTAPEEGDERLGIGEMKHVEGFYWFWSELLRRNPRLAIDNCCGGGRRIDLETAARAYTLWRSDFNDVGEGLKDKKHWPLMGRADQVMVGGLSLYYPLHTGPVWDMHPYSFRSALTSGIVIYTDTLGKNFSPELARRGIAELKQLRHLWEGDYYPLLPLTTSQADWYAYQLDRPDLGEGCGLVFRRPEAAASSRTIELQNIDPEASYLVSLTGETYDQGPAIKMKGRRLARQTIAIDSKPGSTLLRYRKRKP